MQGENYFQPITLTSRNRFKLSMKNMYCIKEIDFIIFKLDARECSLFSEFFFLLTLHLPNENIFI